MSLIKNILGKIKGTKSQSTVLYYSYYLFGCSNDKPIWYWENWKKCIPLLQPIIDLSPELPFIKTSQIIPVAYGKDKQFKSFNKGGLSFDRMIWNEINNEKWTTKYVNEDGWTFFNTEIAFPTRSYCHKNNITPDLLITIHNENLNSLQEPIIDQAITIHIKTHLINSKNLIELEKYIYQIGLLLNWKIAGKIKRPTSYASTLGIGYTDSFWDGAYGVLAIGQEEFSDNYKRYGIEKIEIVSS